MEIFSLAKSDAPAGGELHRITDLKSAVRDQNRVNVFVDGKFDFSLDIAQVVDLGVKVGLELPDEQLEELRAASEFGKLYQRTLEWVLTRPHSYRETQDYLKRVAMRRKAENRLRASNAKKSREERQKYHLETKILPEISSENIALVLTRLSERGYLDDTKFAQFYAQNRFIKRGVSQRRLEMELRNKGIAPEDISKALDASERDETEEIRKIIAKKRSKYDDDKLIQYLTRQGFDYQLAQSLVHEKDSQNWE